MKILAWIGIGLCVGLIIATPVCWLTGLVDDVTLLLRALIVVPFVLFWSIRELRRSKDG